MIIIGTYNTCCRLCDLCFVATTVCSFTLTFWIFEPLNLWPLGKILLYRRRERDRVAAETKRRKRAAAEKVFKHSSEIPEQMLHAAERKQKRKLLSSRPIMCDGWARRLHEQWGKKSKVVTLAKAFRKLALKAAQVLAKRGAILTVSYRGKIRIVVHLLLALDTLLSNVSL